MHISSNSFIFLFYFVRRWQPFIYFFFYWFVLAPIAKERKKKKLSYRLGRCFHHLCPISLLYSILQMGKRAHNLRENAKKGPLHTAKRKREHAAFVWVMICIGVCLRLCQRHWNALIADEIHFRTFSKAKTIDVLMLRGYLFKQRQLRRITEHSM